MTTRTVCALSGSKNIQLQSSQTLQETAHYVYHYIQLQNQHIICKSYFLKLQMQLFKILNVYNAFNTKIYFKWFYFRTYSALHQHMNDCMLGSHRLIVTCMDVHNYLWGWENHFHDIISLFTIVHFISLWLQCASAKSFNVTI